MNCKTIIKVCLEVFVYFSMCYQHLIWKEAGIEGKKEKKKKKDLAVATYIIITNRTFKDLYCCFCSCVEKLNAKICFMLSL